MTRFPCFSNGVLVPQISFHKVQAPYSDFWGFFVFFAMTETKQIIHIPSPEPLPRLSLPACFLSCVTLPASTGHLPYPDWGRDWVSLPLPLCSSRFSHSAGTDRLAAAGKPYQQQLSQEPCIFFLRYNLSATKTYSMVWRASLHLLKNHYGTQSSRMLKCHWCGFLV